MTIESLGVANLFVTPKKILEYFKLDSCENTDHLNDELKLACLCYNSLNQIHSG